MERLSGSHEQRPLLNNSAVILQNPIDEQGTSSVDSLWMGATNHERLWTTGLDQKAFKNNLRKMKEVAQGWDLNAGLRYMQIKC